MSKSNGPQLDTACRILTVSSSLAGAKVFINLLSQLSSGARLNPNTSEGNVIPWTIVNRYYSADVHFAAHVIHAISPMMFDKPHAPPAVIYVWVDGESYIEHVQELSRMMGGYEPEVSLAVRIPKNDETAGLVEDHSETERENNTDIDTALLSYGFEYIDATGEVPLRRTGEVEDELPSTDDIPHLPRVLDALSTIMWPSMKSVHKGSGGFDDKSRQERDLILGELLSHGRGTMPSFASHRESEDEDDLTEHMQELLHSEERKGQNTSKIDKSVPKVSTDGSFTENTPPWVTSNPGKSGDSVFSPIDSMSLSPFDEESTFPFGMKEPTGRFSIGFEDDFTVFVSAPALNYEDGETTPDAIGYHKQQENHTSPAIPSASLEPRAVRYHNLRSVSDFEGSDFGDGGSSFESVDGDDDNDEDDDLPTKEEILNASAKIFGSSAKKRVPAAESGSMPEDADAVPPFDLSQVMSALQQFKTDISGMENDEERRKAAAKVALGLVYGLEA